MKVPQSVLTQMTANPRWVDGALPLFSAASARDQTYIISAAETFEKEYDDAVFINDRKLPKELILFCQEKDLNLGNFLRAIIEYQSTLEPTNKTKQLIELNSLVVTLQELNKEIDHKKVELKAVKQELNAARRERYLLRAEAEKNGELSLVNIAMALALLPNTVLASMVQQKHEESSDWYTSLPEKLTAENMRTSWAALPPFEADAALLQMLEEDSAKARSMIAAAVALRGEDLPEEVQHRHFELVAGSESYFNLWTALEKEYNGR